MALEFDPYKRPPAARLLAILVTGLMFAWVIGSGARLQNAQMRRDPEKFYRSIAAVTHRSPAADAIIAIILVTVIVFMVDALTSLFGRWLRERPSSRDAETDAGARADALLGAPTPPDDNA